MILSFNKEKILVSFNKKTILIYHHPMQIFSGVSE